MMVSDIFDALKDYQPDTKLQLVKDIELIEKKLPNELSRIYDYISQGFTQTALENIRRCSAEIRAMESRRF